jgi:hypothetical protein
MLKRWAVFAECSQTLDTRQNHDWQNHFNKTRMLLFLATKSGPSAHRFLMILPSMVLAYSFAPAICVIRENLWLLFLRSIRRARGRARQLCGDLLRRHIALCVGLLPETVPRTLTSLVNQYAEPRRK